VSEPTFASEVARVTFYEDRAEVARRARVMLDAGATWIKVIGIGVAVDDASLVAQARSPGARVLAARVHRQARQVPAASAAEIEAIEADLRAARARRVGRGGGAGAGARRRAARPGAARFVGLGRGAGAAGAARTRPPDGDWCTKA
jgi:hypothetical protein